MAVKYSDPLSIDCAKDLKRVDNTINKLLSNRDVWRDFLLDPNGTLINLGLHPPTSSEINSRVNRVFYASLTNRKLIRLVNEKIKTFKLPRESEKRFNEKTAKALKKGFLEHDVELDLAAVHHFWKNPTDLQTILSLGLHDLNEKRILENHYTKRQINEYIKEVVTAIKMRKPMSEHPVLESWDRNHGIGKQYGGLFVEAGVLVTAGVAVEVGAAVTSVAYVYAYTKVIGDGDDPQLPPGPAMRSMKNLASDAAAGDEQAIQAVTVLGRMLDLSAELLRHAHNFEAR